MAGEKLVGANYVPPDHVAKVTGRAKYAEDFRAEGMLFAKLLLSPMPHARVRSIDASAALAMPGVKAIVTADDVPDPPNGGEKALTKEPFYAGEPVLAVAAVDEETAAEAIERIVVDFEALPFTTDPLDSLRPGTPAARLDGNVWSAPPPPNPNAPPGPPAPAKRETLKWTEADFAAAQPGQLPMGQHVEQWAFGDLDAGFAAAALTLDETFVVQSTGHHPMETRSAMAYWQGSKLFLHLSTQSVAFTRASVANWVGIPAEDVVLICEYTGGGFGSKGAGAVSSAIPAFLSKKANAPVMMRISREEEGFIGRARTNMTGRAKVGFAKDGKITALDLFIVQDSGAYGPMGDFRSGANAASLDLPAGRDARARGERADQHAAAHAAAVAGPDAGQRHHGAGPHQGGEAAGARPGGDPPHQLARGQGQLRAAAAQRPAPPHHQRVREAGARPGQGAVPLGRAQGAERRPQGLEGARRRRDRGAARRGQRGLRLDHDDPARRQAVRPVGRRQPGHALGDRPGARGRRHPGHAVGEGRGHLGQHGQAPAVDVPVGGQPDHARDDARQLRRRDGRQAQAAGDRRDGSRRQRPTTTTWAASACSGGAAPAAGSATPRPRSGRSRSAASSTATRRPRT